jgi:hypothetical protein
MMDVDLVRVLQCRHLQVVFDTLVKLSDKNPGIVDGARYIDPVSILSFSRRLSKIFALYPPVQMALQRYSSIFKRR